MELFYALVGFYVLMGLGLCAVIAGMGALWTTVAVKAFKHPPQGRWLQRCRYGEIAFWDDGFDHKDIYWRGIRIFRWNFGFFVYSGKR